MKAKKIEYYILKSIDDASDITPKGNDIRVVPHGKEWKWLYDGIYIKVFEDIVLMLKQKDVIKFIKYENNDFRDSAYIYFGKGKYFDDYLKNLYEEEITNNTNFKETIDKDIKDSDKSIDEEVVYRIEYNDKTDEITINNLLLAKPNFDSVNKYFFKYMYENPHKMIFLKDIKDVDGKSILKNPNNIINDLGFKDKLKEAFFKISKGTAYFRNPVTKKDLEQLGIDTIKIQLP